MQREKHATNHAEWLVAVSAVVILRLPDGDPGEASRFATQTLKQALAPFGRVEVFTFTEPQFDAHWKPLHEPVLPARQQVFEAEHEARTPNRRHR